MAKRQKTLDFFVKKATEAEIDKTDVEHSCSTMDVATMHMPSTSTQHHIPSNITNSLECSYSHENDIGLYIGTSNLTDLKKKQLLDNPFCPPKNYAFPFSEHNKKNKIVKRYLNQSHLDKYPWLIYSPSMKGVYCKYCTLSAPKIVGDSRCQSEAGILVSKPLTKFLKLLGQEGILEVHQNNKYHKNSIESSKEFLKKFNKPENELINIISSSRLKQVEENRQRLLPIIDTIITLGKQNIPLRGHRDDGSLLETESQLLNNSITNEGNFREILKLRIRGGDKNLEYHLKNTSANATYISKTTQNSIIDCCREEILQKIKVYLAEEKYYSVLFDETTDISTVSQISVILRYLYKSEIREDFIGFFDLHELNYGNGTETDETEPKIDGVKLGKSVINILQVNNFDLNACVGICTDTCSVMMSEVKGAVSEILKSAPYAVRIPCYNHSINLTLSKCLEVQGIRNCFGVMREVITFFHASAKRSFVLKNILKSKLSNLCDTRWVERHDTSLDFEKNLNLIIETLKKIRNWKDTTSSTKAGLLINSLLTSQFLVSLKSITHIFSSTVVLSKLFQKKTLDLTSAGDCIKDLLSVLSLQRENVDEVFNKIWKNTSDLAGELEITLDKPRITGKQTKRANYSCDTSEDYWRITVFIPMLDEVILDLKTRFNDDTINSFMLSVLMPENLIKINTSDLESTLSQLWTKYSILLMESNYSNSETCFKSEVALWKAKWIREGEHTYKTVLLQQIFDSCDVDIYPNCKTLLKILLTLPISVASAERSFSALRRLKTWLRNRMSGERLSGLALLHINRDIMIEPEEILKRFAASQNRRLDFVL